MANSNVNKCNTFFNYLNHISIICPTKYCVYTNLNFIDYYQNVRVLRAKIN